jgi:hypothetical protein
MEIKEKTQKYITALFIGAVIGLAYYLIVNLIG